MLPDDALLEIFDFYVGEDVGEDKYWGPFEERIVQWETLAHVCRRWRSVVFQSPLRLNLRLLCTDKTPARDTLDIWPCLPLVIRDTNYDEPSVDNIIAALEHNDRMLQIHLENLTYSKLGYVTDSAAMQKTFLELTALLLCIDEPGRILPDSFLGGTAPRLRTLVLWNVPFLGLPKLLLSAIHLVTLQLFDIPCSGYIPPEVMATSLSALTSLESLRLDFRSPRPRTALESRRPPLPTPHILPNLATIWFHGASEYLEVILARINAPRLEILCITFFNQIVFNLPQLFRFISRTPMLRAPEKGVITFNTKEIYVKFPTRTPNYGVFAVKILSRASEWRVSSLEQVCTSSLPPVSTLEDLYIYEDREYPPHWKEDVENTLWLGLLRSFVTVKNLYLSKEFAPRIAPALQEIVGGRTTEVLPALENIFLEDFQLSGPLIVGIEKFYAARRLTSHPVAVFFWDGGGKTWGSYTW